MELRQLRYFIKAKELLNFTAAAEQLFISQSTLSQQIKQLEDELGIPLFDRVGKYVRLTEAGAVFYNYAIACVNKATDGLQHLKELSTSEAGHLVIGTTFGLKHILTKALPQFHHLHPHVTLEIIFGTSSELNQKLAAFQLDFILTFEKIEKVEGLKYQPLFTSKLGLIVRKDAPLATKKSVSLKEVKQLVLALPAKGFSTRRFVDEVFFSKHISPEIGLEINDIPTLLEMVETGLWSTILTRTTFSDQQNLVFLPIRNVDSIQQAGIVSLIDVYEKQSARAFIELLLTGIN